MSLPKNVADLQTEISEYLEVSVLDPNEKNMVTVLSKLLELFFWFNIKDNPDTNINSYISQEDLNDKIDKIKEMTEKFLIQNYEPKEFYILNVVTFSNTSEFIGILLQNLCFYFKNYKRSENLVNIYYYIFHLIYYILLIIIKNKKTNYFEEYIFKFYIYHIIHFFEEEKKAVEYNYFFYEGAFKFLAKKYHISIEYLFKLEDNILLELLKSEDINKIISRFYLELSSKKNQNEDECNFISNKTKIKMEIDEIIHNRQYELYIENKYEESQESLLLEVCLTLKDRFDKVRQKLSHYKLTCKALEDYIKLFNNFIETIKNNSLTEQHFNLMSINYEYKYTGKNKLDKYIYYLKYWQEDKNKLEQDYTDKFTEIINSKDFHELYSAVMKSSYVRDFVDSKKLRKVYDIFIKEYINDIHKYIIYIPLTKGVKALISNYFRIGLNINSVDIIDISEEKTVKEILKSYLLIMLIHESFHFIFRLDKNGDTVQNVQSPESMKLKQPYSEIGEDIILHLFGTEYITFISIENSKLLNNIESWKKNNTNFKVFKKVYLLFGLLEHEEKKYTGSGLKCNISLNENKSIIPNFCNDAAVRHCF